MSETKTKERNSIRGEDLLAGIGGINFETTKPAGITLLKLVIKYRTIFLLSMVAAVGGSILFTSPFFITPKYSSEAIIYPPAANSSNSLISYDLRFGNERDIDNHIQVLKSGILQDSIIRKYNLMEHYSIDPNNSKAGYLLTKEYNRNVSIDRTRYNSISITVADPDPEIAAKIANDVVSLGDKVKSNIVKVNLRTAYNSIENEMKSKMMEINTLADSINLVKRQNYLEAVNMRGAHYNQKKESVDNLRNSLADVRNKENIYDLSDQYNNLYESYLLANSDYLTDSGMVQVMSKYLAENDTALVRKKAEMAGAKILSDNLRKKLHDLNKSGEKFNRLSDNYYFDKLVLSSLQGDYESSISTFDKEYENLQLTTLKSKYEAELAQYNILKPKYELALSNLTDQIPSSYLITPATPSLKKSYPKRALIIILVTVSVMMLVTTALYLKENSQYLQNALKS